MHLGGYISRTLIAIGALVTLVHTFEIRSDLEDSEGNFNLFDNYDDDDNFMASYKKVLNNHEDFCSIHYRSQHESCNYVLRRRYHDFLYRNYLMPRARTSSGSGEGSYKVQRRGLPNFRRADSPRTSLERQVALAIVKRSLFSKVQNGFSTIKSKFTQKPEQKEPAAAAANKPTTIFDKMRAGIKKAPILPGTGEGATGPGEMFNNVVAGRKAKPVALGRVDAKEAGVKQAVNHGGEGMATTVDQQLAPNYQNADARKGLDGQTHWKPNGSK